MNIPSLAPSNRRNQPGPATLDTGGDCLDHASGGRTESIKTKGQKPRPSKHLQPEPTHDGGPPKVAESPTSVLLWTAISRETDKTEFRS